MLIDTVIKNEKQLKIFLSYGLKGTPVLISILDCYSEILKKELATPGFPFKSSSSVIWIENDSKEVLSGICFDFLPDGKEAWINLSFTNPPYRGQQLNQLCHYYFEEECKKKGIEYVGSIVSVNNTARLNSAKKVGLEPLFYRTIKKL